jgi:hypothetical protein
MQFSKHCAASLFALCLSSAVCAQSTLVLGSIERVEYVKEGTEFCPVTCPQGISATKDGASSVCMSRHGDCELVQLKVVETLAGEQAAATLQVRGKLGEFGRPIIPMETRLVLAEVNKDGWAGYTAASYSSDGIVLLPKSWAKVDGVDLVPMKNERGAVPLASLKERLREKR